jgi:hypothetical protein
MFLDIEAGVDDDFTDSDSEEIGGAFYIFFNILIPNRHHLIDDFIDDVPNILAASGSETQPTVSWNTFEERDKDLDNFIDELYERSQSHRTELTAHNTTTDDYEDNLPIHALPTDQDFPLWRIRCRVSFSFIFKHNTLRSITRWVLKKRRSSSFFKEVLKTI